MVKPHLRLQTQMSGQILITATFCAKIDEQKKKVIKYGMEISATKAGVLRKFWTDSSLEIGLFHIYLFSTSAFDNELSKSVLKFSPYV